MTQHSQDRPTSVYRYYDRVGVLLYVGITGRGALRNAEHYSTKEWWQYVARQEIEHYGSRSEAASRETSLIRQYQPPFNRQHNPEHEVLRAAYVQMVEQERPAHHAVYLQSRRLSRGHRIVPLRTIDHHIVTWPAHANLIARLVDLPSQLRMLWYGHIAGKPGNGQIVGTCKMRVLDEFAVFTPARLEEGVDLADPAMEISMITRKGGNHLYRVRAIHLALPGRAARPEPLMV